MPRVYELIALIEDRHSPNAYFQNFEVSTQSSPAKRRAWLAREKEFNRLDDDSWSSLKAEALPYLTKRDGLRGWSQFIAILNQARAHNYLVDEGFLDVRFIPRAKSKGIDTPDIRAVFNTTTVLCEVKTIQISDAEAKRRAIGGVGTSTLQLEKGFFNKLTSDLLKARKQTLAFDSSADVRRIAFIIVDFDDFLGEYKDSYYQQIDDHLATKPVADIEVILYNQLTAFHAEVSLKHAKVISERAD